jgi:leader peptidase (prepilin peptidase) / N-methyltransferase
VHANIPVAYVRPHRLRRLVKAAEDMVLFRGAGRRLAPLSWFALMTCAYVLWEAPQFGGFFPSTIALFGALSLIALFDACYFIIPDGPILFLAVGGVLTTLLSDPSQIPDRLAAAILGYFSLRFTAWLYEALRGAPGLGYGDVKLFAIAGLWLGLRGLPSCLLIAAISALISSAISFREGTMTGLREPFPFGPHLALGIWLIWSYGPFEAG